MCAKSVVSLFKGSHICYISPAQILRSGTLQICWIERASPPSGRSAQQWEWVTMATHLNDPRCRRPPDHHGNVSLPAHDLTFTLNWYENNTTDSPTHQPLRFIQATTFRKINSGLVIVKYQSLRIFVQTNIGRIFVPNSQCPHNEIGITRKMYIPYLVFCLIKSLNNNCVLLKPPGSRPLVETLIWNS